MKPINSKNNTDTKKMKTKFSFKIETLLFGIENPKGAIDKVLFAQKVAQHEGFQFNRLALITFSDPTVNNALDNADKLNETLLIAKKNWTDMIVHLCVKIGQCTLRIATGCLLSKEVTIHSEYRNTLLLRKLTDEEINRIFSHVWNNMDDVEPDPNPLTEY
ncbi:hypothetical protein [Chryseobacterium sp.]|uniref:hypothetical protein n=1 Tax=Chryseobacterium sp. TaxID=1871047 RepID=UPI00333E48A9